MEDSKQHEEWSDTDRARLREIVKQHEHRRWLFDIAKRWALWVTAIAAGVRYSWEGFRELIAFITEDKL